MPVYAVLPRAGKKEGKEPGIEETVMMEEKKMQLDKIRKAFQNPEVRGWIDGQCIFGSRGLYASDTGKRGTGGMDSLQDWDAWAERRV